MNTVFDLPQTVLLSQVVQCFDTMPEYHQTPEGHGVAKSHTLITYESIYNDVRAAVDYVHDSVRGACGVVSSSLFSAFGFLWQIFFFHLLF